MRSLTRIALFGVLLSALTFGAAAQTQPLNVVASFSILADVVQNVTLNTATVMSLIPVGTDPHSFEPSARDVAELGDADLIFVTGANFEESLLHAIENAGSDAVVAEASACVPIRPFSAGEPADEAAHEDTEEHTQDEAHTHEGAYGLDLESLCAGYDTYLADLDALKSGMGFPSARAAGMETLGPLFEAHCPGHEDEEKEHEAGSCDPHVWSDPRNVYYWTLYIRDVLSAADPANAEIYSANAEEYLYAIDDLLRLELEPLLSEIPAENRVLLTNHETLNYFAAAYDFNVIGFVLPGGSALAETSAQDLAALIDLVRDQHVPAIFAENTVSSQVAEQVSAETDVQIFTLYTDSLSDADGAASTYLDYITYNFTTIAAALTPR